MKLIRYISSAAMLVVILAYVGTFFLMNRTDDKAKIDSPAEVVEDEAVQETESETSISSDTSEAMAEDGTNNAEPKIEVGSNNEAEQGDDPESSSESDPESSSESDSGDASAQEGDYVVLTKKLPVYTTDSIDEICEDDKVVSMLKTGDSVSVKNFDASDDYALIEMDDGSDAFVWKDCIGKAEEYSEDMKVVVLNPGYRTTDDTRGMDDDSVKNEYKCALDVAKATKDSLKEDGYCVVLTRHSYNVIPNGKQAAEIGNKILADAEITLMYGNNRKEFYAVRLKKDNSENTENAEVLNSSEKLTSVLMQKYGSAQGTGLENISSCLGGQEWSEESVLNESEIPSTVLVLGNLNVEESKSILEDNKLCADAIKLGIEEFFLNQ